MKNYKLENITQKDVNERKIEVAVIPIGATEPHNYHLPYGTDFFHADYVSSESCRIANEMGGDVIKLPVIPYGVDANMMGFPFALNVYQKTLNLFLTDIVNSLAVNKIKKIVIINGHGGNDFKPFLRDLMPTEVFISYIDWWKVADDEYKNIFEFADDHSGEMKKSKVFIESLYALQSKIDKFLETNDLFIIETNQSVTNSDMVIFTIIYEDTKKE